ncbi:MAG: hypothetical protein AUJ57_02205 [Zetaproteobacteria bacterium CG1_02_53_45]|nr:MAG: hypothetical protein AUJ57_02205 [Zetaproteobacteria bacterium CG1_02_53_45]
MTMKKMLNHYHQSLIILAIGLSLSALFFFIAKSQEQQSLEEMFRLQSDIQFQDITSSLTQLTGKVDAIHGFIRNKLVIEPGSHQHKQAPVEHNLFSNISFEDFLFLNTGSKDIDGWQTYAWFPRVTAEQIPALYNRAKSDSWTDYTVYPASTAATFPVYYIDTKDSARYPTGYDISSKMLFSDAIESAVTAAAIRLVIQINSTGEATVGLLRPLYKGGYPPRNRWLREKELLGFVYGEWRLDSVIAPALAKYQWNDRTISITAPDRQTATPLWNTAAQPVVEAAFIEKRPFMFAGSELFVEFRAGSAFIANHSSLYALRVLGIGIIITLLLVYYLFLQVSRQKSIEREVRLQISAYRRVFTKLESLLENFKGGIAFEDANHQIVLTNNCIYDLLALDDSESLIDQSRDQWLQTLTAVSSELSPLLSAIDQESGVNGLTVKTHDGKYLEVDFIPIHRGGRHEGNIWILRDVTEKELMHQQFEHAQRLEGMGVLAGGIAHDFNNILTAIIGNTALIERKQKKGLAIGEYIERINSASDKAANLCRQMLAYSGRGKFVVQNLNLAQQVKEITDFLRVSLPKSIMIEVDLDTENLVFQADATQIRRLF